MKSKFKEKINNTEIKYPCLMKYNKDENDNFIVLFNNEHCGTVVHSENSSHNIGDYYNCWTLDCFTMIKGKVILKF